MSSTGCTSYVVTSKCHNRTSSASTDKCSRYPLSRAARPRKRRHGLQVSLRWLQGRGTVTDGDTAEVLVGQSETVVYSGLLKPPYDWEYKGRPSPISGWWVRYDSCLFMLFQSLRGASFPPLFIHPSCVPSLRPFISHRLVWHPSGWFVSLPPFIYSAPKVANIYDIDLGL